MDRDSFYKAAMTNAMPDAMDFQIRRGENHDLRSAFSIEAYETVGYQMHDFLMARTLAYQERNRRMPRALRAELRLVWDDDRSDEQLEAGQMEPWYAIDDNGITPAPADGSRRMFLSERRESMEEKK